MISMFSDLEKKTYYKHLVRRVTTDMYLGKWLRMKTFFRWIEPRLDLSSSNGAKALDLGAGDGILSFYLSEKYPFIDFTGADMDDPQMRASESVARRLKRNNLKFRFMNILEDNEAEQFDFIFSLDILEHIEDDAAAANNIARLLKPGGSWVISVPNRLMLTEKGEWIPSIGPPDHVRTGYDLDVLENLVRSTGLKVLFHQYYLGKRMIAAWGLFNRLDKIVRPATIAGLPFYHLCFLMESDPAPSSGNFIYLVAEKPAI